MNINTPRKELLLHIKMSYNSLRKEVYDGLDVEEGFRIPVANEKNKKLENKVSYFFLIQKQHYFNVILLNDE